MIQHPPKEVVVRAVLVLTGAYVYSDWYSSGKGRDQLALLFKYVNGDETSASAVIQWSDNKTDAYESVYENTAGDGVITPATEVITWTASKNQIFFRPSAGLYFRVGLKATGGTPTGTMGLKFRADTVSKGA